MMKLMAMILKVASSVKMTVKGISDLLTRKFPRMLGSSLT